MTSGLEESSDMPATTHQFTKGDADLEGSSAMSSSFTFFKLHRLDFSGVVQCLLTETGMFAVELEMLKN